MIRKNNYKTERLLHTAKTIFWDFDGVIKDSVRVKSDAFEQLFLAYGRIVANQVRMHHEAHGGMSRFDKMPIYLGWAGEPVSSEKIQEFCERFAQKVQQAVIDSPWVSGVREYLLANYNLRNFVLVTATPQEEMNYILVELGLSHCFCEVHGAPANKAEAIRGFLARRGIAAEQACMVGDSESDFQAAQANRLSFILRRTPLNSSLQQQHTGASFEHL
jgi:phosphoglycolate phosphatase-like HAD superfamily hydrolase